MSTQKCLQKEHHESSVHPFVKWAGGKTQIVNKLKELMPQQLVDTMNHLLVEVLCYFLSLPNMLQSVIKIVN